MRAAAKWARILVCGFLMTLVWTLLSMVLLTFVGNEVMNALPPSRLTPGNTLYSFGVNFLTCIWALWLYVSLRPANGSSLKAQAVAAFGWWSIYCLSKANWGAYGLVSPEVLFLLLVASLPAQMLVMFAGARLFEAPTKVDQRATQPVK